MRFKERNDFIQGALIKIRKFAPVLKKIGFEFDLKIDPIFVYEFIKKMEEKKVVILINKLDK